MTIPNASIPCMRELDHRRSGGIDVTLLWAQDRREVLVCVSDDHTGDHFVISPGPSEALTAFRHPYAFAARHHQRVAGRIPELIQGNRERERS